MQADAELPHAGKCFQIHNHAEDVATNNYYMMV